MLKGGGGYGGSASYTQLLQVEVLVGVAIADFVGARSPHATRPLTLVQHVDIFSPLGEVALETSVGGHCLKNPWKEGNEVILKGNSRCRPVACRAYGGGRNIDITRDEEFNIIVQPRACGVRGQCLQTRHETVKTGADGGCYVQGKDLEGHSQVIPPETAGSSWMI